MPSHPRRCLSITARLITGYTVGCFACLLLVGWLSNHTLRQRFEKKHTEMLANHLAEIRKTINIYPDDLHEVAELIVISSAAHHPDGFHGRLSDGSGLVLSESPDFSRVVPDMTAFPTPLPPGESPGGPRLKRLNTPSGELFLLSARIGRAEGRPELLYEVALNAGHVEEWLTDYNRILGLFIALATSTSALFGWLVARGGLAPLRHITRSVREVTATGLHQRLGAEPWPAELASLAAEFDRMLERLDDSFKRLSQFTADAAHEFRTPLNNLMGATSLLLSRERTSAEYREALVAHLEHYHRLNRMLESLLFLARADDKSGGLDFQPIAVGELMGEIVEFFTPLAEDHDITLTSSGEATLRADESLLRMAFINLVANAIRFTPPGGTVALAIAPSAPGQTLLTVADTGCGIPPEHLPRIFDRFYRVESARSSAGAGLGLSLVRTIMEIHGGSVTATSEPGCGTTFHLIFPDPASLPSGS